MLTAPSLDEELIFQFCFPVNTLFFLQIEKRSECNNYLFNGLLKNFRFDALVHVVLMTRPIRRLVSTNSKFKLISALG